MREEQGHSSQNRRAGRQAGSSQAGRRGKGAHRLLCVGAPPELVNQLPSSAGQAAHRHMCAQGEQAHRNLRPQSSGSSCQSSCQNTCQSSCQGSNSSCQGSYRSCSGNSTGEASILLQQLKYTVVAEQLLLLILEAAAAVQNVEGSSLV